MKPIQHPGSTDTAGLRRLGATDLEDYDGLGFVRLSGFADQPTVDAMLTRVVDIVHDRRAGSRGQKLS